MSRRAILAWISSVLFGPVLIKTAYGLASEEIAERDHQWVEGPFYINVAATYEEPRYYPPSALLKIEHCLRCGMLRLPKAYWEKTGANLSETRE